MRRFCRKCNYPSGEGRADGEWTTKLKVLFSSSSRESFESFFLQRLCTAISVQFSSVQYRIYTLGKAQVRSSTPSPRSFPSVAFETIPMFVWLTMALSRQFFHGRSSSTSSFNASLLQTIDGVMSLASYPQVLRCLKFLNTSDPPRLKQATCGGCFALLCLFLLSQWLLHAVIAMSFPAMPFRTHFRAAHYSYLPWRDRLRSVRCRD